VQIETLNNFFTDGASLDVLRLDLPDPVSYGNKFFKMKYHLQEMRSLQLNRIITFGGAFSNHIAAVAVTGKKENIETVGIVRGDELSENSNEVLRYASSCGMKLIFISREEYRKRNDPDYRKKIMHDYPGYYFLNEGGSGILGMKGCKEILSPQTKKYDVVVCPVGTGTTLAGIISSAEPHQEIIGVTVLEGKDYLEYVIKTLLEKENVQPKWKLNGNYTFGGYGNTNSILKNFISEIKNKFSLPLDPVYSGKALFGIPEMQKENEFSGKHFLFIHTGGYAFTKSKSA
jgi:1-aminocyclopropane-1-carboxylate deaminase